MMPNCIEDLQNLEKFEIIQNDIDKVCQWTIKWRMFFNVDKCKILHICKDTPHFDYQMEVIRLQRSGINTIKYHT